MIFHSTIKKYISRFRNTFTEPSCQNKCKPFFSPITAKPIGLFFFYRSYGVLASNTELKLRTLQTTQCIRYNMTTHLFIRNTYLAEFFLCTIFSFDAILSLGGSFLSVFSVFGFSLMVSILVGTVGFSAGGVVGFGLGLLARAAAA